MTGLNFKNPPEINKNNNNNNNNSNNNNIIIIRQKIKIYIFCYKCI